MVLITQNIGDGRSSKDSPFFNKSQLIQFDDTDTNTNIATGYKSQKKLFNLKIIKKDCMDCLISSLQKDRYTLCFTFDFYTSNKNDISLLLEHNYNKPEIKSDSPDYFCLKYIPKLEPIKTEFIDYMITEYLKGDEEPCEALVTFDKDSFTDIHNSILDPTSNEISGKLKICEQTIHTHGGKNIPVFVICVKDIGTGSDRDCDIVESRYNFHTHPSNAYKIYNCELGWPSCDDYIIFSTSTAEKKTPTLFHLVCTVEGIYALTIPKESIQPLQDFKDLFNDIVDIEDIFTKYIQQNLNVSKKDFNCKDGVNVGEFCVKSVMDYLTFINEIIKPFCYSCEGRSFNFRLVEIKFFEWSNTDRLGIFDRDILFTYFFPKIKGNCYLIEDHVN
jgi:hypothetical protein